MHPQEWHIAIGVLASLMQIGQSLRICFLKNRLQVQDSWLSGMLREDSKHPAVRQPSHRPLAPLGVLEAALAADLITAARSLPGRLR